MPRPFVFNVSGGQRDRLVQIKIQLMVRGTADETLAKQNIPLIEGTLLRVFSAATSEQLMTFEGKEKLRKDSLEECRRVLNDWSLPRYRTSAVYRLCHAIRVKRERSVKSGRN